MRQVGPRGLQFVLQLVGAQEAFQTTTTRCPQTTAERLGWVWAQMSQKLLQNFLCRHLQPWLLAELGQSALPVR
jgi:hypothetical protein